MKFVLLASTLSLSSASFEPKDPAAVMPNLADAFNFFQEETLKTLQAQTSTLVDNLERNGNKQFLGRRLAASPCAWGEETPGLCDISRGQRIEDLSLFPDGAVKEYYTAQYTCLSLSGEADCKDAEDCHWRSYEGACRLNKAADFLFQIKILDLPLPTSANYGVTETNCGNNMLDQAARMYCTHQKQLSNCDDPACESTYNRIFERDGMCIEGSSACSPKETYEQCDYNCQSNIANGCDADFDSGAELQSAKCIDKEPNEDTPTNQQLREYYDCLSCEGYADVRYNQAVCERHDSATADCEEETAADCKVVCRSGREQRCVSVDNDKINPDSFWEQALAPTCPLRGYYVNVLEIRKKNREDQYKDGECTTTTTVTPVTPEPPSCYLFKDTAGCNGDSRCYWYNETKPQPPCSQTAEVPDKVPSCGDNCNGNCRTRLLDYNRASNFGYSDKEKLVLEYWHAVKAVCKSKVTEDGCLETVGSELPIEIVDNLLDGNGTSRVNILASLLILLSTFLLL
jgi:hypothetical protein